MAVIQGGGITFDRSRQMQQNASDIATVLSQSRTNTVQEQQGNLLAAEQAFGMLEKQIAISGKNPAQFIAEGLGNEFLDAAYMSLSKATGKAFSQEEARALTSRLIDYYAKNPTDTQKADILKYQFGGAPAQGQATTPPSSAVPQGVPQAQSAPALQRQGSVLPQVPPKYPSGQNQTFANVQNPVGGTEPTGAYQPTPGATVSSPTGQPSQAQGQPQGQVITGQDNKQYLVVPLEQPAAPSAPQGQAPAPAPQQAQSAPVPQAQQKQAPLPILQSVLSGLVSPQTAPQAHQTRPSAPYAPDTSGQVSMQPQVQASAQSAVTSPPRQVPQASFAQQAPMNQMKAGVAPVQSKAQPAEGKPKKSFDQLLDEVGASMFGSEGKADPVLQNQMQNYWNRVQSVSRGDVMAPGHNANALLGYLTGGSNSEFFGQFTEDELKGGLASFVSQGRLRLAPTGYAQVEEDSNGNGIFKNAEGKTWKTGDPWPAEAKKTSMLDLSDYPAFEKSLLSRGMKVASGPVVSDVRKSKIELPAQIGKTMDAVDVASGSVPASNAVSTAGAKATTERVNTSKTVDQAFGFSPASINQDYTKIKADPTWLETNAPKVADALGRLQANLGGTDASFKRKSEIQRDASVAGGWVNAVWNQMSPEQKQSYVSSMKTWINDISPSEAYFQFGKDFAGQKMQELGLQVELSKAMATKMLAESNLSAAQQEAISKQISDVLTAGGKIIETIAGVATTKKQTLTELFKTDLASRTLYNDTLGMIKTFSKAGGIDFTVTKLAVDPGWWGPFSLLKGTQIVPETQTQLLGSATAGMSAAGQDLLKKYGSK